MCRLICLFGNLINTARVDHNIELEHDKTNKMAYAPSEDSDHPDSLIKVFAVGSVGN